MVRVFFSVTRRYQLPSWPLVGAGELGPGPRHHHRWRGWRPRRLAAAAVGRCGRGRRRGEHCSPAGRGRSRRAPVVADLRRTIALHAGIRTHPGFASGVGLQGFRSEGHDRLWTAVRMCLWAATSKGTTRPSKHAAKMNEAARPSVSVGVDLPIVQAKTERLA